MSKFPPTWIGRLLRSILKDHLVEEIEGDLMEYYSEWETKYGRRKANRLYLFHAIKFIRPYSLHIFPSKQNQFIMLKTHFKLAWRQLKKQKIYSTIKIGSFVLAIAACCLITLYVQYQKSFDTHYEKQDSIFRLINRWSDSEDTGYWANVHGPLKEILVDNIPEIENIARTVVWDWGDAGDNLVRTKAGTQQFYEEGFIYADSEILSILEIPMLYGSQEEALSLPNSIVISERKAAKYFPNTNPVGEQLVLNDDPEKSYTIGGVMKETSFKSHLSPDFILTLEGRKQGPGTTGWCCTNYHMYVRLREHASRNAVMEKTKTVRSSLVMDKLREAGASGLEEMEEYQSYYLQAVADIYVNPEKVGDGLPHGSAEFIWVFSIASLVVLVLACINFINLSTAKALVRAKEVGIRKAIGSFRSTLIQQYLLESWMNTFFAFIIGILLASVFLPSFNQLAGTTIIFPWQNAWFTSGLVTAVFVIGILSGLYPAYYLSSFPALKVLKGKVGDSGANTTIRNSTIIFQFIITFLLIVSALVLYKQFDFVMNKTLGYSKDQVVNIMGLETMNRNEKELFKSKLKGLTTIQNASSSDFMPVDGGAIQNRSFWINGRKGLDNGYEAAYWWVDEDYISTMQIELKEGRNFRKDGDDQSIIINEQMKTALNLTDPLGKQVIDMFDETYTVIGVIKDFHFESILQDTRPLALVKGSGRSTISIKINSADSKQVLASVEKIWQDIQPGQPLRYQFMDIAFERMYKDLNRAKTIFISFSILAISIACSGLFALSMYMTERRLKEVGIRKVLGAGTGRLVSLLGADFVKLILIAVLIAVPISWYFLDEMMADFANRIDLAWYFFFSSGVVVLLIGIFSVSYETIRATLVNPAQILKDE
ncbi:MAG: ABC transporter permease [Bacteroidota bacterium]